MPKARKNDNIRKRTEFVSFVNVDLRKNEKNVCEQWWDSRKSSLPTMLDELAGNGYSLTVKEDKQGDSFACSLNGYYQHCNEFNRGKVLVGRAGSVEEAIARTLWYHYVLCEQSSWEDL